ncbi:MAG: HlyD family secretion protein [Methylocella sp.]
MRPPVILAVALAAAAGAVWWWARTRIPPPAEWQGYAEADFVKVGPTQQGLLTSIFVARGVKVAAGAPLFEQDDTSEKAAVDQAARQLAQAEAQLTNLQASGKQTEIEQAEANLAEAQANLARAKADLQRNEPLVRLRAVSIQSVDQLRADYRSAEAKVHGLEAALTQLRAPLGRIQEIAAQQSAVGAARAALAMAKWRLDQRHVAAPATGTVNDVLARPGETIPAGVPVVSLLPPENIFVRFFVPEPMLATVHLGGKVTLLCDNCPAGLAATISFIAPQAEYTPPVIYSESSRAKLVYKVEARPPLQQAPMLNPGQPVTVRPIAKGGSP